MLLFGAKKEDINYWMELIVDSSTDIRLCVKHFLKQHYPDAPIFAHTPDTNAKVIQKNAIPVQKWYMSKFHDSQL